MGAALKRRKGGGLKADTGDTHAETAAVHSRYTRKKGGGPKAADIGRQSGRIAPEWLQIGAHDIKRCSKYGDL